MDKGDKLTVPQAPPNITIDATLIEKYPSIFSDYTYSFDGWYLDKECSQSADVTIYIMTDEPVTFYAKWIKIETI